MLLLVSACYAGPFQMTETLICSLNSTLKQNKIKLANHGRIFAVSLKIASNGKMYFMLRIDLDPWYFLNSYL